MPYIWGVDSAQSVSKELYNCVLNNYGKPEYWGRYLSTVPNAAEGLIDEEIELLHNSGTKVMPIYNDFREAVGERNGRVVAQNAVYHANRLGFPKGTILYANVERFFDVDEAWIRGYVNSLYNTDFRAGIYHDPVEGAFKEQFNLAVNNDQNVRFQSILWSAEPEVGVTKRRDAPTFNPTEVSNNANVWGWQYGRDADDCPIDTNLVNKKMYEAMW